MAVQTDTQRIITKLHTLRRILNSLIDREKLPKKQWSGVQTHILNAIILAERAAERKVETNGRG